MIHIMSKSCDAFSDKDLFNYHISDNKLIDKVAQYHKNINYLRRILFDTYGHSLDIVDNSVDDDCPQVIRTMLKYIISGYAPCHEYYYIKEENDDIENYIDNIYYWNNDYDDPFFRGVKYPHFSYYMHRPKYVACIINKYEENPLEKIDFLTKLGKCILMRNHTEMGNLKLIYKGIQSDYLRDIMKRIINLHLYYINNYKPNYFDNLSKK